MLKRGSFIAMVKPTVHTNSDRKRSSNQRNLKIVYVLLWTEDIWKTVLFENTDITIINMGYWPSQDGWILAKFFFCVFMDREGVEVHKLAKEERGQYLAILTEKAWSTKDLLFGFRGNFSRGTQWVVPSGKIVPACRSGSQSQCAI